MQIRLLACLALSLLTLIGCGRDTGPTERSPAVAERLATERDIPRPEIAARSLPGMATPGSAKDRAAMAEWELARFRDPATGRIPPSMRSRELLFVDRTIERFSDRRFPAAARPASSTIDLGQWQALGPDYNGGRTRSLVISIDGNYFLSGAVSGGLFRMQDVVDSVWVKRSDPGANQNVTAIAQDIREGYQQNWYYATGELRGGPGRGPLRNSMGGGVYRSTDSGRSWSPLQATIPNGPAQFDSPFEMAWRLVVDHTADGPGTIYLAGFGGIMRSDDGGESWQIVLGTENGARSLYTDIAITSDGILYAAIGNLSFDGSRVAADVVDRGIWRSTDGVNWTSITPPGLPSSAERTVIATAPSDSSILYVLAVTRGLGTHGHQFWRYRHLSGDGTGAGGEWEDRTENLPDDPTTDRSWGDDFITFTGFCMSVDVHPLDADVVFLGSRNLHRSDDGFATDTATVRAGGYRTDEYEWGFDPIAAWYLGHHPDHHGIAFFPPNPSFAFSFTDGGPHLTADCLADTVDWFWFDDNYLTLQFYSVAIDPRRSGDRTIVGGTQDNNVLLRLDHNEDFWHVYAGDGARSAVDLATNSIYVSNIDGNLWRVNLRDDGRADSAGYVMPAGAPPAVSLFPFRVDPNRGEILYVGIDNTIWRNSNVLEIPLATSYLQPSSINWQRLAGTTRNNPLEDNRITAISPTVTAPTDRLYYGRVSGKVARLDDADEGNPVPVDITGQDFPSGFVNCIAVDPRDGDRAVVVFSNYNIQSLFLTEDGGDTWSPVGGNLEENPDGTGNGPATIWLEMAYRGDEVIYLLGTSSGLFATTALEGMQTEWQQVSSDLIGRVIIEQIAYRETDGMLVVATHGNGLYESRVVSGVEERGRWRGMVLDLR